MSCLLSACGLSTLYNMHRNIQAHEIYGLWEHKISSSESIRDINTGRIYNSQYGELELALKPNNTYTLTFKPFKLSALPSETGKWRMDSYSPEKGVYNHHLYLEKPRYISSEDFNYHQPTPESSLFNIQEVGQNLELCISNVDVRECFTKK